MLEKLRLYHTNDLHSHFENWPKIVHYIEQKRSEHEKNGEETLVFDIGDHMDRFQMITEATFGKANVDLLNRLEIDAAAVGNNEGITLPHDELADLYTHAAFPVIVSNLFDADGQRPEWAEPYVIKTLKNGMTAGILGITVPYYPVYQKLGWTVTDAEKSIQESLDDIKGKADIIILLSHLGLIDDRAAAEKFPDIDVILESHTHHLLEDGQDINGVLLACAEKYGNYVGCVELTIESESRTIVSKQASVQKMADWQGESEDTAAFLKEKEREAENLLSVQVANLNEEAGVKWFEESPLPLLLAEALKSWCGCEVSMVNSGVILGPLQKGPVTKLDLHRICPHPINPVAVRLSGRELQETISQAASEQMEQLRIKGLGFRGEVMGRMVYAGAEAEAGILEDGVTHLLNVKVNGEEIDPERIYSVAVLDMFTLGKLFPYIRDSKEKQYFMPEFLRDLLAWKLARQR
ncbi:bifunctional UDP-sugar hydrolase/5'-nucleotidase [Bacillus velezensis]|uniref:bifunctional metallophosphatase/5'-nucleotidase n=1 Tax=Bacillus velezensis TaxID=492670 RepID=UPI0028090E26|nr:bifunctional UDP-sugar hydrolase/5'-nucleotidase [Bacillus velezensis]MDQ8056711.1 bifunctional UDP-sugar hydrolase/5'-nucleotidase [Bacillus velezensis]